MMLRILALSLFALLTFPLLADDTADGEGPAFYLEDGDRVVLLGGTIIEREQVYGEWELMLTCLYADADFTVRNLGWSGDTVWAESRGIFDPPEVGYQRMIDQIKDFNPTVVILAYGHNEAWAGEEGLDAFITQYEKLIDDIQTATEAETRYLIIMPHEHFKVGTTEEIERQLHGGFDVADLFAPVELAEDLPEPAVYNELLQPYLTQIQVLAEERRIPHVSTFVREERMERWLSHDGVTFNHVGYSDSGQVDLHYQLATLGGVPYTEAPVVIFSPKTPGFEGGLAFENCLIETISALSDQGRFQCRFTRPNLISPDSHLYYPELPDGDFEFRIDDDVVAKGPGRDFGVVPFPFPTDTPQREALRQAIIRKNELYFHRWRPQNVTYLFGFRAHEQGNNAVEIPQFDPLIEEQEALIRELKHPVEHLWELAPAE